MATPETNAQILNVGKQCHHSSCNLVDFLPFKCQHCWENFCQEHFMVDAHKCPQYDESKHNRVAPDCPLCNTPVAIRPSQDPNIRMEEHFMKECSVMTGKAGRTRTMPTCDKANCKKVLFSPIRCDKCRKQFCASHRFPSDHTCSSPTASAANSPQPGAINLLSHLNTNAKVINAKASAAGTATLGAIKKNISTASSNLTPASSEAGPSTKSHRPFSKVDRFSYHISTSIAPTINRDAHEHDSNSPNATIANVSISTSSSITVPVTPKPAPFKFNSFKPRPIFVSA